MKHVDAVIGHHGGVLTKADLRETATLLRRLLDAVDRGDLEAASAPARALVRRIEGAATALEIAGR